jgi:hypothetical protein
MFLTDTMIIDVLAHDGREAWTLTVAAYSIPDGRLVVALGVPLRSPTGDTRVGRRSVRCPFGQRPLTRLKT